MLESQNSTTEVSNAFDSLISRAGTDRKDLVRLEIVNRNTQIETQRNDREKIKGQIIQKW